MVKLLAFDLGATSGRAVIGHFSGEKLTLEEIHRFPNTPVPLGNYLYWDFLNIYHQVETGVLKASQSNDSLAGLGIDSWGVDFGLISQQGDLLGNPIHYRDHQTDGMMDKVFAQVSREDIFQRTGIQFMQINTLFHLYAMKQNQSPLLEKAESLLMIPSLLRYFLTGEKVGEFSSATTTQLYHVHQKQWDLDLIRRLGLPDHIFPSVVQPGTLVGSIQPSVQKRLGLAQSLPVIAVTEHDTGSAVVSIPTEQKDFAYLSCGTWSLLGTEIKEPVVNQEALRWNFTNEGGFDGTYRFLKNIMGLWLIEECRRIWEKENRAISYEEMLRSAETSAPFVSLVDPDDDLFLHPDHMPEAIQRYCRLTDQRLPRTQGEITRCILESLACKYRYVLEKIEEVTGNTFSELYMVGGGSRNQLLCQFTANAIGRPVYVGPTEGTAAGNVVVQLVALRHLKDIREARQLIRKSFPIQIYEPQDEAIWQEGYEQFCLLLKRHRR